MTDRCPKCGRPKVADQRVWLVAECERTGSGGCIVASHGYRAGLIAGVALAKEYASPTWRAASADCAAVIDWSDVDRELAKRVGRDG